MRRSRSEIVRPWPLSRLARIAFLTVGIGGCHTETVNEKTMPNRDVNAVMESHVDELMAIPDVVGVAIGALEDGSPCIQVLVRTDSDQTRRRIPASLEGHPVKIIVSGEIRPLDAESPGDSTLPEE